MPRQTRRQALTLLTGLACTALVGGCATIESKKRADLLAQRARDYVRAVRWGDFRVAASLHRRRDGEPVQMDLKRLQQVRVTHDEHSLTPVGEEDVESTMRVRFDYQPPASASVDSLEQTVVWWYDAETENWYIDADMPQF